MSTFRNMVKPPVTNGLILWWRFNELSGTILQDSSGYGNIGTLTNGATWVKGPFYGNALNLNGSNQNITTNFNISNKLSNNFTINIWVNVLNNQSSGTGAFLWSASVSGGTRFYLAIPDSTALTSSKIGLSSWNPIEANTINLNTWNMWTIILSGANGYFYLNGALKDSQTGITVSLPNTTLSVGQQAAGSEVGFFNGNINNFRIYNRALSTSEISTLYHAGE